MKTLYPEVMDLVNDSVKKLIRFSFYVYKRFLNSFFAARGIASAQYCFCCEFFPQLRR